MKKITFNDRGEYIAEEDIKEGDIMTITNPNQFNLDEFVEERKKKFNEKFMLGEFDYDSEGGNMNGEINPTEIQSFLDESLRLLAREIVERMVGEEKHNLITEKKRLTYSDVDDAYNKRIQEEHTLASEILGEKK